MSIGENIRDIRKSKNMSQSELGKLLGVSQAMIAQYENGTRMPKIETLAKIAEALGTHPLVLNGSISEEHAQSIMTHVDSETALISLIREFYGYIDERQVRIEGKGNLYYYAIGSENIVISDVEFDHLFNEVEKVIRNYITAHGHSEDEEIELEKKVINDFASCNGDFRKIAAKMMEYLEQVPTTPIAAHNDHADEPGELEKMQEDVEKLKRPED